MLTAPPFNPELEVFRRTVREFIQENLPQRTRKMVAAEQMDLPKEVQAQWHRILRDRGGWCCPSWPSQYGGPQWSDAQQYIFEQELALNDAPRLMIYGVGMLGPTLFRYGSESQKETILPDILDANTFWCQGFSEPNSGSDLASLKCDAQRVGDEYIINGSKIWTSEAHIADWIFGLFRTGKGDRKQQGITFLMIDLSSSGITVDPLLLFEGTHEVNQVHFEDVRVAVENRVGAQDHGWEIGKYLLGLERFGTAEVSRTKASLERLRRIAHSEVPGGSRLIDNPSFAEQFDRLEISLHALEMTERRFLLAENATQSFGAEASMLKVRGTEIQCDVFRLTALAGAHYSQLDLSRDQIDVETDSPYAPGNATRNYFNYRKTPIYSGSNEIQRNIVAKAALGL
ncbi:MAG: acyl-CoA dehydrogenase family protein [Acidiferrobacterales bacterium]|nr:acyl-CoA dehydrogenase family protein [Acidiferrobacterales bacterium]